METSIRLVQFATHSESDVSPFNDNKIDNYNSLTYYTYHPLTSGFHHNLSLPPDHHSLPLPPSPITYLYHPAPEFTSTTQPHNLPLPPMKSPSLTSTTQPQSLPPPPMKPHSLPLPPNPRAHLYHPAPTAYLYHPALQLATVSKPHN